MGISEQFPCVIDLTVTHTSSNTASPEAAHSPPYDPSRRYFEPDYTPTPGPSSWYREMLPRIMPPPPRTWRHRGNLESPITVADNDEPIIIEEDEIVDRHTRTVEEEDDLKIIEVVNLVEVSTETGSESEARESAPIMVVDASRDSSVQVLQTIVIIDDAKGDGGVGDEDDEESSDVARIDMETSHGGTQNSPILLEDTPGPCPILID